MARRATVASAAVLAVLTFPIVWLIGYQDHPWRRTAEAVGVAALAVIAAAATHVAGRKEEPAVVAILTWGAVVIAVGALTSAVGWHFLQ